MEEDIQERAVGARWMLRVATVPKAALFPVVLVLCVVGAYALNNTMGFPLAPFILGVVRPAPSPHG